jgi:hypothetical protein
MYPNSFMLDILYMGDSRGPVFIPDLLPYLTIKLLHDFYEAPAEYVSILNNKTSQNESVKS